MICKLNDAFQIILYLNANTDCFNEIVSEANQVKQSIITNYFNRECIEIIIEVGKDLKRSSEISTSIYSLFKQKLTDQLLNVFPEAIHYLNTQKYLRMLKTDQDFFNTVSSQAADFLSTLNPKNSFSPKLLESIGILANTKLFMREGGHRQDEVIELIAKSIETMLIEALQTIGADLKEKNMEKFLYKLNGNRYSQTLFIASDCYVKDFIRQIQQIENIPQNAKFTVFAPGGKKVFPNDEVSKLKVEDNGSDIFIYSARPIIEILATDVNFFDSFTTLAQKITDSKLTSNSVVFTSQFVNCVAHLVQARTSFEKNPEKNLKEIVETALDDNDRNVLEDVQELFRLIR